MSDHKYIVTAHSEFGSVYLAHLAFDESAGRVMAEGDDELGQALRFVDRAAACAAMAIWTLTDGQDDYRVKKIVQRRKCTCTNSYIGKSPARK